MGLSRRMFSTKEFKLAGGAAAGTRRLPRWVR